MLTLAPTVWFIDSGELAAVASTLGIAHPTGYPFFTVVGHFFTLLPFSSSEVYKLNVMSAFFCSLGVFVFFYLMNFLFGFSSVKAQAPVKTAQGKPQQPTIKKEVLPAILKYGIMVFSCLVLAFSATYWDTANAVEVYPIHCFFVITLMLVFLRAIFNTRSKNENSGTAGFIRENKLYILFAFLLGLSFTNHLTTILLAPACLTLFFAVNYKDKKRMLMLIAFMAAAFIISFSLYLYLPIKAGMQPALLWGNPFSFERFYWHITGKQFSVWIFSAKGSIPVFLVLLGSIVTLSSIGIVKQKTISRMYHIIVFAAVAALGFIFLSGATDIVAAQFKKFTASLGTEFGTGVALLALIGVYRLSKGNVHIYYFTLLAFFGCMFYSVNYDIHDIDSYFLLAYIVLVIWIGFGMYMIAENIAKYFNTAASQISLAVIIVLLSLIALNTNWEKNDESKNYFVEEYTMNIFKNIEPNGIVLSTQWDFWVSASWYYNYVKKLRTDIVVIDKELLRRSWYFTFLERHYPEIYNNSRAEIERFQAELYKFEHDVPYDTKTIMKTYSDLLTSLVVNNPTRKFYSTWEIDQNKDEVFATDYARVPNGVLNMLVKKENVKSIPDYKTYDFTFTPTAKSDYYHKTIMSSYASMLTSSASYLVTAGRIDEAKKYLNLALIAVPNFPQALDFKRKNNL